LKGSPVNESPLGLFDPERDGGMLESEYGIPRRYLTGLASPWAVKRLAEFEGDISKFRVVRIQPSVLRQVAIAKTEPGDENNQDISSLVGKIDIRKLEHFAQDDADAYSYSGGLCLANQGLLEFVEMFKAPIKMLHPLLTATQEGNFKGTEGFGAIPFSGIILAHSNESEWQTFRNNRHNEAFLDRVYIVKVPYCLQVSEEVKIYRKLLRSSALAKAPCAPGTLEMMAQFSVLSRLKEPENSNIFSKMRIYDGENLKDVDPTAKTYQEYREYAGLDEGMAGVSTRFSYKVLSSVFNYDAAETAANPVHLMYVLEQRILKEDFPEEAKRRLLAFVKEHLAPRYAEFIGKEIQTAYLESYSEYGQNIFDRYVTFADYWIQDEDYRDPETGEAFDRSALNAELEKIEKPAGIANPKDFRNEIVNFVLRARAQNGGQNPKWTSYEKLREVIETKMFSNTEELLPVISFNAKASVEDRRKHENFVARMVEKGYTEKQVRLLAEWYLRVRKSA
jgi:serine protein kinase